MSVATSSPATSALSGELSRLASEASDRFRLETGAAPDVLVAAPGRVNLIGEHVDYNGGFVLPMAIDRHVVVAASPIPGRIARMSSTACADKVDLALDQPQAPGKPTWANYPRGVLHGFAKLNGSLPAFHALVHSDLPLGAGLSSSAALEVSSCLLFETLSGHSLAPTDRVRLCQLAEHTFAGVPCGIMDQFIVTSAQSHHALLLDCQSLATRQVPFGGEVSLLVTHCGVAHELSKGQYALRRSDCDQAAKILRVPSLRSATLETLAAAHSLLSETQRKRARHVVTEIQRTVEFADCLQRGDWTSAGQHMYASHQSLRHDYEVSCPELDLLVELAQHLGPAGGVYGARLTGGGFGGCTVTLVRTESAEEIRRALVDAYHARIGISALSFVSPPVAGARRL